MGSTRTSLAAFGLDISATQLASELRSIRDLEEQLRDAKRRLATKQNASSFRAVIHNVGDFNATVSRLVQRLQSSAERRSGEAAAALAKFQRLLGSIRAKLAAAMKALNAGDSELKRDEKKLLEELRAAAAASHASLAKRAEERAALLDSQKLALNSAMTRLKGACTKAQTSRRGAPSAAAASVAGAE